MARHTITRTPAESSEDKVGMLYVLRDNIDPYAANSVYMLTNPSYNGRARYLLINLSSGLARAEPAETIEGAFGPHGRSSFLQFFGSITINTEQ